MYFRVLGAFKLTGGAAARAMSRAGGAAFFTGVGAESASPNSSVEGRVDMGLATEADEAGRDTADEAEADSDSFSSLAAGASLALEAPPNLAASLAGIFGPVDFGGPAAATGAGFAAGFAPALHLTSTLPIASVTLAFCRSVTCSRYAFIGRSPKILAKDPKPSAAALRTGSSESPSCPTMAGAIVSRSDLEGASRVFCRARARN